jgi:hypothetical protein
MSVKYFLHCYDGVIIDPVRDIGAIVDLAHRNDRVEISVWPEAPDLSVDFPYKGTGFLSLLTELCDKNKWPKSKFEIITGNILQAPDWPHIKIKGSWEAFLCSENIKNVMCGKNITKKFGCFISGSSWPRLWLSAYLYKNHQQDTCQTFLRSLDYPGHALNLDIDNMLFNFSHTRLINEIQLSMVTDFLKNIPLTKQQGTDILQHPSSVSGKTDAWQISPLYNEFFLDVVCETFYSGNSFRPTEKTARPIMMKTPFVVMASPNFLSNIRKIGFRTFGKFWNEDYDYLGGVQRLLAIKEIIDKISKMSLLDINKMISDMQSILDHNQRIYFDLNEKKLDTTFSIF